MMNVGATGITDAGLYFSWGDTQGYTGEQCGSGSGKKYFSWADYKYSNNGGSSASDMTKYNSADGKTVLEASDDAVAAAWGGSWRMPTKDEYVALGNAVNRSWNSNYQGSGVAGIICTDKTDSSKVLFFPACGYCNYGRNDSVGSECRCWSSSLNGSNVTTPYTMFLSQIHTDWKSTDRDRRYGFPVRGVLDE